MSEFVEQCRREWKRLGVPDPLAEEMAADLASDLGEAEADGVSAEELLGSSAFDPRSFAASWAAERGIIPVPPSRGARRRPRFLAAFTALAAVTLIVAALLLATGQPRVSLVASSARPRFPAPPAAALVPPGTGRRVVSTTNASAPVEWILLFIAIAALGFSAWLWSSWGRSRQPGVPA
jgi:hypothetical protein